LGRDSILKKFTKKSFKKKTGRPYMASDAVKKQYSIFAKIGPRVLINSGIAKLANGF